MSFRILPRGRRRERTRGQSLVEFALVLPIMLILLAAAIDLGRLFYAYVAVENAAKEGAFYGSRNPLCDDSGNPNCANPNNVVWHVQNEATNIGSQFSTNVSCWTPAGALVQPMNDCLDGYTYRVTVSYPFRLLTPILGSIVNQNLNLASESQATVISDAFDPTGLEVLVWVNNSNAINGPAIATACTQADVTSSPNFYYAPCQDSLNVPNYLQFAEAQSVSYKVRVRNTGNIGITGITYGWQENGASISSPGTCNTLPTAMAAAAAPAFCTFTKPALASNPVDDIADHLIAVTAQGSAGALSTGQTNGSALIKVLAVPKLTVNLRASPYRLGDDGDGLLGNPQFANGNLTLRRNTSASLPDEINDPTGWFYLTIANSGGTARNFALTVTQQGTPITLPCSVPTQLAGTGQSGNTFTCLFPRTFDQTQAYPFVATATADNSIILAGSQTAVTVTTNTCTGSQVVIPNLVDTLDPTPNGNNKTVGQAKSTWTAAGFNVSNLTTQPGSAGNSLDTITQNQVAYTCANNANQSITIRAQ
jgi:hypothetical protein